MAGTQSGGRGPPRKPKRIPTALCFPGDITLGAQAEVRTDEALIGIDVALGEVTFATLVFQADDALDLSLWLVGHVVDLRRGSLL